MLKINELKDAALTNKVLHYPFKCRYKNVDFAQESYPETQTHTHKILTWRLICKNLNNLMQHYHIQTGFMSLFKNPITL